MKKCEECAKPLVRCSCPAWYKAFREGFLEAARGRDYVRLDRFVQLTPDQVETWNTAMREVATNAMPPEVYGFTADLTGRPDRESCEHAKPLARLAADLACCFACGQRFELTGNWKS